MILDALERRTVLFPVLFVVGLILYELLRTKRAYEVHPKLPKLPIIGAKEGEWFPTLKAMWRNSKDVRTFTLEAYAKFRDVPTIFPVIDLGSIILVPPGELGWYLDQPDSELSTHEHLTDVFQLTRTLPDPYIMATERPIHHVLIISKLTREVNNLLPTLASHMPASLAESFGTETEYKDLCPWDVLPMMAGRVVNHAFVGSPTCYNQPMIASAIKFAHGMLLTAGIIRMTPQVLRPIVSSLVTLPHRLASRRFFNHLRPELKRRLNELSVDPSSGVKYNDFLQWIIDEAVKSEDPYMRKPEIIMGRVLMLNNLSIHTSTLALSHLLLDLAACSPDVIEELRNEILAALMAHGGEWNKRTLEDMPKLDSVFRESQRMNPPATIGAPKVVTSLDGVTMPSGLHLKHGTHLGFLQYPVQRDPEIYPEPDVYKPFRFAELREAADEKGLTVEKARQGWAVLGNGTSAFGSGRHACPGRFFASTSLKIFLACILLHYDIEPLAERPPLVSVGMAFLPPFGHKIRIRRRKEPLREWA